MNPTRTRSALALSLSAALSVALLGQASAQKPDALKTESKAKERISGVIIKTETPEGSGGSKRTTLRLSVNTDAVWRDWARDQVQFKDRGPASKDAAKGAESVATEGEPADKNSVVVIDVTPETKVETRFRTPDDEASKGVKGPAGKGAVSFQAKDLKKGLFVEADFATVSGRYAAKTIAVIRPLESESTAGSRGDRK